METQVNDVSLDPLDVHCGHIYLHEPSMMLKFFCIFCQKTFDDINYYCNHLTEHVDAITTIKEDDITEEDRGLILDTGQEDNSSCFIAMEEIPETECKPIGVNDNQYIEEVENVENMGQVTVSNTENSCSDEFYGYSEEELDDDEEESRQFLFENDHAECYEEDINNKEDIVLSTSNTELDINSIKTENLEKCTLSVIDNHIEYDEELDNRSVNISNMVQDEVKVKIEDNPSQLPADGVEVAMDFENLIGNAKIIKPAKTVTPGIVPSPEVVVPAPPVKTFKIITLKNQIEELYSMVNQAHEDGNIIEEMKNSVCAVKKGIERTTKIIGETVITSLPVEINVERSAEEDVNEYKCHACDKVFRNQHSLSLHGRAHYMESHSDIKVAHRCTECNELFNKLKDLQSHIQNVHYPDGLKCRLCHKVLRSIGLLEVHMRKMHLQQTCFLRCRFCGLMNFTSIEDFEEHSKTHGKDDKFKCYICGRQYTVEGNLKQHVLRHSIGKGDRCVVCGKVTQRLTQHMKMHSPRPTRLLQCSICNKTFSFSSALSRHTKVMHKLPRTRIVASRIVRNENTSPTKRRRKPRKRNADNNTETTYATEKEVDDQETVLEEVEDDDLGADRKVIVEMIENVMNRKTSLEDYVIEDMDCTVARYETIAAVHSITSPTDNS